MWIDFFVSMGGAAAGLAVTGFLAKNWLLVRIQQSVKHEYDKALEDHRSRLAMQVAQAIEQMKASYADAVEERAADKTTLQALMDMLPVDGRGIGLVRHRDMGSNWHREEELFELSNFSHCFVPPLFTFHNEELETKRNDLLRCLDEFLNHLAVHAFVLDSNQEISAIYPELKNSNSNADRSIWQKAADEANFLAKKVCIAYDVLIECARSKLKC